MSDVANCHFGFTRSVAPRHDKFELLGVDEPVAVPVEGAKQISHLLFAINCNGAETIFSHSEEANEHCLGRQVVNKVL